jgi:type IV pilus assembly protein PilX
MRNHIRILISPSQLQQGFVLVVALVLLLVLTLLGLAAAQSTSLEERMAGNARNHDLAFQAAEAGLSAGITCLQTGAPACSVFNPGTTGNNGMYQFSPTSTTVIWAQPAFWTTAGNALGYNTYTGINLPQVAAQPQFIIEQLPPVAAPGGSLGQPQFGGGAPAIQRWRITSRGTGGDKSSEVMLQAVYQCCG